ncbi:MAG: CRISPR-associated endonuclease Cas1 [Candidatus Methanodesulfokora sp.]
MRLVINEPGTFIGVKRGMVVVKRKGKEDVEIAPSKLSMVAVLTRGASISAACIKLLSRHGVNIVFYSRGRPVSWLKAYNSGSVMLRKEQYRAQEDERGVHLAKSFVQGKLQNQRSILLSLARNRMQTRPDVASELRELGDEIHNCIRDLDSVSGSLEEARPEIVRIEAKAADLYWRGIASVVKERMEFPGRRKKFEHPRDPLNIVLNFMYSLLSSECTIAVEMAGMDPFAGYLHADSPRRPALAMDLMEQFRQPVVDRAALKLVMEEDLKIDGGFLDRKSRELAYRYYASRLSEKVTFLERSLPYEYQIHLQARRLADYLMGRINSYTPFSVK